MVVGVGTRGDRADPGSDVITKSGEQFLSQITALRDREGLRLDISPDKNPFRYLEVPLKAAVSQVGRAYLDAISSVTPDNLRTKVRQFLNRDDLLASNGDLFKFFSDWVDMPIPSDAVRRAEMRDPIRFLNKLSATRAELGQVVEALTALREAIQIEGLDRPLLRPDTRQPSVQDLELVAWELVVGPVGLPDKVGTQLQ